VNPSLVYAHQGTQVGPPKIRLGGLGRCTVGLAVVAMPAAFLRPMAALLREHAPSSTGIGWFLTFGIVGALRVLTGYARQSGLASLQIGMMRLLGYQIPERFDWPLLARDPLDFWRRWNIYVNGWLLRYVFWPLATGRRSVRSARGRSAVQALSVIVTFGVAGLLHDAVPYGIDFTVTARSTAGFVASGLIVLLWVGVRGLWARLSPRARQPVWEGLVRLPILVILWISIISIFAL
jgi:hypothetical protein